jgi:hypothetical protein
MSRVFSIILLIILVYGCGSKEFTYNKGLMPGDLVFQDLNCGDLCDAIEKVTEGINGRDFSHCGIIVIENDSASVLEAIGKKVQVTRLHTFLDRSKDHHTNIKNCVFARIKNKDAFFKGKAVQYAVSKVGNPYDDIFLMDTTSWYCSEIIYAAFKHANNGQDFFKLYPMTYKDPATNQFFPAWVNYYKDLKHDIPEGLPGLNPGGISRDEKLEILEMK